MFESGEFKVSVTGRGFDLFRFCHLNSCILEKLDDFNDADRAA